MVGGQRQDHAAPGLDAGQRVQRRQQTADLPVEPAQGIQLLLGLVAERVGDHVVGREGQGQQVGHVAPPQGQRRIGQHGKSQVGEELILHRRPVDGIEIAAGIERQVVIEAEPQVRRLEAGQVWLRARPARGAWRLGQRTPESAEPPHELGPAPPAARLGGSWSWILWWACAPRIAKR